MTGPKTATERLGELRAIARRRGLDKHAAVKHVGYAEIVAAAGDTMRSGSKPFLFTWRMCSAIAHGDFWATINAVSAEELPGAPPGIAHLKVTASVRTLFFAVYFAAAMTSAGWRLFDQRGTRQLK
ncbi:hypothetical protein E1258_28455 [Micromonospora sp. KC207]|uniref:hypothetical protein n=1 Tax=Micromonospora sp. KC207 TaxID=2530377 RepID=UPI001053535D|nr:hypothetical protein [Micromonospora sp. KC207]TDC47631.1 hypothetical protein E1258_28455 [Micromonospora sp. KC207]